VIRLKQFGIQRYALPLDLLAGFMLFLSLDRLLRSQREVAFVFGLLPVAVLWTEDGYHAQRSGSESHAATPGVPSPVRDDGRWRAVRLLDFFHVRGIPIYTADRRYTTRLRDAASEKKLFHDRRRQQDHP
jgi:hypothetical protein